MVYKYEEENKEAVMINPPKANKEMHEVYHKAKAWDNYLLSVEEDAKNEFRDNEDLVKHAVELNKKIFMEDE